MQINSQMDNDTKLPGESAELIEPVPATDSDREQRQEERYPCVGIPLLYSPAGGDNVTNLADLLHRATVIDMSLSGLAFDIDKYMEPGKQLVILLEKPAGKNDGDSYERLMTRVIWCKQLPTTQYRTGVEIESTECGIDNKYGELLLEAIGNTEAPREIDMLCPACGQSAIFSFVGNQPVLKSKGIMPLYNCSACSTTRSLPGMLYVGNN